MAKETLLHLQTGPMVAPNLSSIRTWLNHRTRRQWLFVGALVGIAGLQMATANRGTDWQSVSGLSFSPDSRTLALGIYSGRFRRTSHRWYFTDLVHTVALADLAGGPPRIIDHESRPGVLNMMPEVVIGPSVAFSSDGTRLASSAYEGKFRIWDVASRKLIGERTTERLHVRALVAIPRRDLLVAAFRYWFSVWNFADASPLESLEGRVNIQAIAPSPDGNRIAFGSLGVEQVDLWDVGTMKRIQSYERPGDLATRVSALRFTPDGKTLIVALDHRIQWLDVATQSIVARVPERMVLALDLSPDGRLLATGRYDGVTLWDLPARTKSGRRWDVPATETLCFSPDGRLLAAGCSDGSVHVWDVKSGEVAWSWRLPRSHFTEFLNGVKIVLAMGWTIVAVFYFWRFLARWKRRAELSEVEHPAESARW